MTYARELDDLRREISPGSNAGDVFTHYPKKDGVNALAGSVATDTAPNPRYEIYSPSGTLLYSATAIPSDHGSPAEYSTLSLIVDSANISALTTNAGLGEDYSIRVYWSQRGDSFQRIQTDIVWFDVVLYPFGPPSVSLNDLLEERPDTGEILHRMGLLLGYGDPEDEDDEEAKITMAGIFAVQARIELDGLIRDSIQQDALGASTSSVADLELVRKRYTRPNLILNRERLNRVERKLAMKLLFAADCKNPDAEDEAAGLLRFYTSEAERAWRGVGPLKYDAAEDLIPDTTITDIGRSWTLRRTQG